MLFRPGRFLFREVLLSIAMFLGCVASFAQQPLPVRDADAVCAKCHLAIYKQYLNTPMANASGSANDKLIPGSFREAGSASSYRIFQQDHAAWLSFDDQHYPSQSGRRRLEYYLGSGHLGVTYLYSLSHYLFESPIAYLRRNGRLRYEARAYGPR